MGTSYPSETHATGVGRCTTCGEETRHQQVEHDRMTFMCDDCWLATHYADNDR